MIFSLHLLNTVLARLDYNENMILQYTIAIISYRSIANFSAYGPCFSE